MNTKKVMTMKDNEIIKALTTSSDPNNLNCQPTTKLCKEALELIIHQQAEIDRLNIELKAMRGAANSYKAHYEDLKSENLETIKILKTAKSEAVREFAENLKRKSELVAPSVWAIPYRAVAIADIDRLLEGMGCNDE